MARVAVIGPGLDFSDKNEDASYDYYPQQTLQPFALYDSLVRLGLARPNAVSMSIFDMKFQGDRPYPASPRAAPHEYRLCDPVAARSRASVVEAELIAYWRSLGDQVGTEAAPIRPPEIFQSVETRAVRVRPEVVLTPTSRP